MSNKSFEARSGKVGLAVALVAVALMPWGSIGTAVQVAPVAPAEGLAGTHAMVQRAFADAGWQWAQAPNPLPAWAVTQPGWAQAMLVQPRDAPMRVLAEAQALVGGSGLDALDAAWGLPATPTPALPAAPLPGFASLDPAVAQAAANLVAAVRVAEATTRPVTLTREEARAAHDNAEALQSLLATKPWEAGLAHIATAPPQTQEELRARLDETLGWVDAVQVLVDREVPLAAHADPAPAQAALRLVLAAIQAAAPSLQAAASAAPVDVGVLADPCSGVATAPVFVDPENVVAIFGQEDNCHIDPCPVGAVNCNQADNAHLRIDLGGNDHYLGRTGSSTGAVGGGEPASVRVSIDVAGDDTYDGGDLAQGASEAGAVGVVADLGGNDHYTCVSRCQGYGGIAGAGALLDAAGTDVYRAVVAAQGVGAETYGAGALLDGGGSDRYEAGSFAQGTGQFGSGLLWDGGGDDVYNSPYIAQGAGIGAATGVLVDVSGDDQYQSEVPGGTFGAGQGASVLGAGLLVDGTGNDKYSINQQTTGVAQASVAIGVGALVDLNGDDQYSTGNTVVLGVMQSAALGLGAVSVMLDANGNDRYGGPGPFGAPQAAAIWQAMTFAIGGAAFLYDAAGNDFYGGSLGLSPVGGARANFGQGATEIAGLSVLADSTGNDVYQGGDYTQGAGLGIDLVTSIAGTGRTTEAYALLVDGNGVDNYLGGFEWATALECNPTTRLYHGIAVSSGAARLFDDGMGADTYAAQIGTTPAANNIQWVNGCDTIRVLGSIDTGIANSGGRDS